MVKFNIEGIGIILNKSFRTRNFSLRKLAISDYDALEDVALSLLKKLVAVTGKIIQDFNFHNVNLLQKLQKVIHDKEEQEMENKMLRERNQHMEAKS